MADWIYLVHEDRLIDPACRAELSDRRCRHELERLDPGYFRPSLYAPLWPRMPCTRCAAEAHAAWVGEVAAKLRAALCAAAEGRTFLWDEPEPDPSPYVFAGMSTLLWTEDLVHWQSGPGPGAEQ